MKQILLICAVVALVGCGPSLEDKYIGEWKSYQLGFTLTIIKDGTYTYKDGSTSQSGNWEVKDKEGFLYVYSVYDSEAIEPRTEDLVFYTSPDDESGTMGLNFRINNGVREQNYDLVVWDRVK